MGQIVSVIREARHPAYSERPWIVDLPDQTRGSIPFSWAVPVDDIGESLLNQASTLPRVRVDVATLLNLAKMVHRLIENQLEEVACDETDPYHGLAREEDRPTADSSKAISSVGGTTSSKSARDDCSISGDAEQADAKPLLGRKETGT